MIEINWKICCEDERVRKLLLIWVVWVLGMVELGKVVLEGIVGKVIEGVDYLKSISSDIVFKVYEGV